MATIITYINLNRLLTSEEKALKITALDNAMAAGTTNGTNATSADWTNGIRIFTTVEAADSWVALFNSFTPPPTETLVETI